MKKLILSIMFVLLISCGTEPIQTKSERNQVQRTPETSLQTTTEPVRQLSALKERIQGIIYIKLGWYSWYSPIGRYFTIKKDGQVLVQVYTTDTRYQYTAGNQYRASWFSVSQTVNGITSEESFWYQP